MLRIAICDDERGMVSSIHKLIEQNAIIHDGSVIKEGGIQIDDYLKGSHLLQAMEDGSFYNLIYLDIEMPDIDGITLARKIRDQDEQVLLVYVSSHEKYMIDLFEVSPFRFIRKPVEKDVFDKILGEAMKKMLGSQSYFTYESGWNECRILIRDIYYFESSGRQVSIVTESGRETFYGKLDEIEKRINEMDKCFIRIHQSYLINPEKVFKVGTGEIELANKAVLPISKKRQKEVNAQYLKQYKN